VAAVTEQGGWRVAAAAMRSRWAILSIVTLLYWIANQALRPYLPLRLEALGASDLFIGAAVAGYSMAGLVLAVPSGRALDRLPQHRLLVGALAGLVVSTAVLPLTRSVLVLAALMFVNGACGMWVWLVLQSMITFAGEGADRRRQLALFSFAWGVGLAAGPSIGALVYDVAAFSALCVVTAGVTLLAAAAAVIAPRLAPHRTADTAGEEQDTRLLAALGRSFGNPVLVVVLLSSFINVFVLSMRISFYPVYLERAGVPLTRIGLLLSAIGAVSLAIRAVLPVLLQRFGMFRVLIWSTWAAILGAAATPVTTEYWVLMVGAVLIGVGLGSNPPITVNLVAEHSDRHDRGLAVGLRMVANRTAQVSQPVLFGAVAAVVGLGIAFPLSGAFLAALTIWMTARLRRLPGRAPADDGRTD
jgi:MFS family permease